jgi:hypothetical protein
MNELRAKICVRRIVFLCPRTLSASQIDDKDNELITMIKIISSPSRGEGRLLVEIASAGCASLALMGVQVWALCLKR